MVELACPTCHGAIERRQTGWWCAHCSTEFPFVDGVGHFLRPARLEYFQPFLRDYTAIRLAEGRASDDPAYYRGLPDVPSTHPLAAQWRMRATSWRALQHHVDLAPGTTVVDVGAGVGWLSNRLAELGCEPVAIDLSVDGQDGLGAARHFAVPFTRLQAEMDALPLAAASADVVVFNASIHYATDLTAVLTESARVLRRDGAVVVIDSPIYAAERDGETMLAERAADFERRFGTRSDSVPSIGFLTPERLEMAGCAAGLTFTQHRVWYGLRWAWRPWRNRLRRRRAPSRFVLLVARPRA